MDQILYVNTASIDVLSFSGSLTAISGSNVDFSQATQVSGTFVGPLHGTTSFVISASHANNADLAATASTTATASYVVGQRIKTGIISGSAFGGNPQTASVVFVTPFPSPLYTISVLGQSSRTWLTQNETATGFIISANTKTAVAGLVYWQAIQVGEFNP